MKLFPQFLLDPDLQDEEDKQVYEEVNFDENPGLNSIFTSTPIALQP